MGMALTGQLVTLIAVLVPPSPAAISSRTRARESSQGCAAVFPARRCRRRPGASHDAPRWECALAFPLRRMRPTNVRARNRAAAPDHFCSWVSSMRRPPSDHHSSSRRPPFLHRRRSQRGHAALAATRLQGVDQGTMMRAPEAPMGVPQRTGAAVHVDDVVRQSHLAISAMGNTAKASSLPQVDVGRFQRSWRTASASRRRERW